MAYQLQDGKYYCARHDVRFAKTAACRDCRDDPGPPPDEEPDSPLPPPPPGCLSVHALEAMLVAGASELARLIEIAEDEAKGYDYHRANTVAKLHDTRLKFLRAAMDLAIPREGEILIKRREKRAAEMAR